MTPREYREGMLRFIETICFYAGLCMTMANCLVIWVYGFTDGIQLVLLLLSFSIFILALFLSSLRKKN